jgi:hypothetical protein
MSRGKRVWGLERENMCLSAEGSIMRGATHHYMGCLALSREHAMHAFRSPGTDEPFICV